MRDIIQKNNENKARGLELAIQLLRTYEYEIIETFIIRKRADSDKFDDLRILSIMPTPWRIIEDVIIDQLAEVVREIVTR